MPVIKCFSNTIVILPDYRLYNKILKLNIVIQLAAMLKNPTKQSSLKDLKS